MISRFQMLTRNVECIRDATWRISSPPSLKGAMSLFLATGSNFLGYQRNLKMRLESVGYGWYVLSQENGVVGVLLQTEGSRSDLRAIVGASLSDAAGDWNLLRKASSSLDVSKRLVINYFNPVDYGARAAWMLRRMVSRDLPGIPHC
ncbi:uncharacterized protein LOC143451442 isoform X2 [Clavelina lepadiformis]|uniref:uncharacterized protein LOC143451441 isoform X2 n=1 Tax=Clavelina lepadiformis TaxID=159417 RepID=UPI00404218A9